MRTHATLFRELLCALLIGIVAGTARAEELYVIGCDTGDCGVAGRIDGVSVYGVLRGALIVGAVDRTAERAIEAGFGRARRLGARSPAFDYYVFRATWDRIASPPAGDELPWTYGRESLVRAPAGRPFPRVGGLGRQRLARYPGSDIALDHLERLAGQR